MLTRKQVEERLAGLNTDWWKQRSSPERECQALETARQLAKWLAYMFDSAGFDDSFPTEREARAWLEGR